MTIQPVSKSPVQSSFIERVWKNHRTAILVGGGIACAAAALALISRSCPAEPSIWQKIRGAYYDLHDLIWAHPDADRLRAKGNALLQQFGKSIDPHTEPAADLAYRSDWLLRQQCPAHLEEYLDYQKAHGTFNGLSVDALRDLYGENHDLTDGQARQIYLMIDRAGSRFDLQTSDCLDTALARSMIRFNARQYTRHVRMSDRAEAALLDRRDLSVHGTPDLDIPYILGKYGSPNRTAACEAISRGAEKTNSFFNFFAKILG
jgi:hypothetical protein